MFIDKIHTEKFIQLILHAVHSMPHCQHLALSFSLSMDAATMPHTHCGVCICVHIIISWNSEWNILTRNYTYQAWKAIKNRCDMVVFRISFRVDATLIHMPQWTHATLIHIRFSLSPSAIAHIFANLTFLSLSLFTSLPAQHFKRILNAQWMFGNGIGIGMPVYLVAVIMPASNMI